VLLQAEAYRSYRRTYLYCLSDRKSMSNQLLQVPAEAVRSCCRTYLCCQPGRKNMSNLLLRELPAEREPELRHRRNRPAEQEPAELH
jgi:hypothetical protein